MGTALLLRAMDVALTDPTFLVCFLSAASCAIVVASLLDTLIERDRSGLAVCVAAVSLLLALACALKLIPDWRNQRAYRSVVQTVVPFTLHKAGGGTVSSEELKGHIVVLAFWATWCPPCRAELPQIEAVAQRYSGDRRVLVLAVNAGTDGDTAEKAQAYLLRRRISVPWVMDSGDGRAGASLGTSSLPVLFILDAAGRVRLIHSGFDASEDLKNSLPHQIERLM